VLSPERVLWEPEHLLTYGFDGTAALYGEAGCVTLPKTVAEVVQIVRYAAASKIPVKCVKDVAGYSMKDVFIGSDGTLGVITKVLLKLRPKPPAKETLLATFSRMDAAAETVSAIIAAKIIPCTLEFLDKITIRADRKYRVGLLTGCVQDLAFSHVNRDTADALLANGGEVVTPRLQSCCGSIHAHNGELELARQMARRSLDAFDLDRLDAVITNAAGCGTHLKNYAHSLRDDPVYAERAVRWSAKLRDVHEWLAEIGIQPPAGSIPQKVTYHEACHLCHGQKITRQPRQVLEAIPGLQLVELGARTH
jgi:Fe-S oxidoreductase